MSAAARENKLMKVTAVTPLSRLEKVRVDEEGRQAKDSAVGDIASG